MSRNDQYRQLIADVRTAYQSGQRELKWCDECQEVNLWNYWQGHGHLDARIMLVGQDWGCGGYAECAGHESWAIHRLYA